MTNQTLGLQAPWITTYNKIVAMFVRDDELNISKLSNGTDGNYEFTITSSNAVKLQAIEKILKHEFDLGNIKLTVKFVYEDASPDVITASDFRNAFSGNPIVSEIKCIDTPWKTVSTYVIFEHDIVQFYNDDISDIYGYYSGLAEDIAREIFNPADVEMHYCTEVYSA